MTRPGGKAACLYAARYSRIGLLKPDAEHFIQFKQHGLNAATA